MPAWMRDPRKFILLINARAETMKEKPAFKNASGGAPPPPPQMAIMNGRRLGRARGSTSSIDATEARSAQRGWQKPGSARTARNSIRSPLCRAGQPAIWQSLHHRVPVAIRPADFDHWLDCSADEAETVMALLTAPHEGKFVWHQVSTRVNRASPMTMPN